MRAKLDDDEDDNDDDDDDSFDDKISGLRHDLTNCPSLRHHF